MTENRLRQLMAEAMADVGQPVRLDLIAEHSSARRRATRIGATVAGLGVIGASVAILMATTSKPTTARLLTDSTPPPTAIEQVRVEGVSFPVPPGWAQAPPACFARDRTVVVGFWTGSCPGRFGGGPVASTVRLAPYFAPQNYGGAQGVRFDWKGQPAWLHQEHQGGATVFTLTLPWLNATISSQSADPTTARQLLDTAVPHPQSDLGVPATADSVLLQSFTGHDGDGQDRSRTITSPVEVNRLLTQLRSLPVTTSEAQACDETVFDQQSVTITIRARPAPDRTYRARFSCGQVEGGTGVAALISNGSLLDNIRRLVPNSGLTAPH